MRIIISAAVGVFVEFPEIVEVESDAEAVPSWESPIRVGETRGPYRELAVKKGGLWGRLRMNYR